MARIEVIIQEIELENDEGYSIDSVEAACTRCGHVTESFGTSDASVRRCLALLHRECPKKENNFYFAEGDE